LRQCPEPKWFSGLEHLARQACSERNRETMDALAGIELIGERDLPGNAVEHRDEDVPGVEHPRQALADELHDGLEVELLRQRLSDLVDDSELRVPLLRLGKEP